MCVNVRRVTLTGRPLKDVSTVSTTLVVVTHITWRELTLTVPVATIDALQYFETG